MEKGRRGDAAPGASRAANGCRSCMGDRDHGLATPNGQRFSSAHFRHRGKCEGVPFSVERHSGGTGSLSVPKSQPTHQMPEPETNSTAIAGSSRTTCSPSYYPGRGCRCAARSEADCGCPGVDWSPSEIYDLRAMLRDARESLAFRRQLYRRQNALMNEMRERLERDANQWETQCRVARIQRDNLAAALAEMRYGHTDKAERMAVSALSYLENS